MLNAVSRLGLLVSGVFRRTAPDPFVLAILLAALTAALALLFGEINVHSEPGRTGALLDAWADENTGFWRFLAFGMQMCLVLITGHVLAQAKPVRLMINAVASLPRGPAGAACLVSFVACTAGLINWGLGLMVGALLAREVGIVLSTRGVRVHYPLLAAAGYSTMMLWHGGLSGSAPLTMTTIENADKVLGRETLDRLLESQGIEAGMSAGQLITLEQTVFSPLNLIITGGLLVLVPLLIVMLAPRRDEDMQDARQFIGIETEKKPHELREEAELTLPDRLDRSWVIGGMLGLALLAGFTSFILKAEDGILALGLNQINMAMFALGLLLHGSPRAYMDAAAVAARGCAGIIVQFPIYGGIMGMMAASGLVAALADFFVSIGNASTMPALSFLAAGIVNLFVPSGGGQWAIQGPIALEAGLTAGVSPAKMIMAVAYGDQLTNMLQPFWALPLLAITGVKARDIVGYTAIIMVAGGLWIGVALLVL